MQNTVNGRNTIMLSWSDVIGISQNENLDLKIQEQDYRIQKYNAGIAISDFLPTFNYQYQIINNIERPVFVIPGFGEVRFGTEYNFIHIFQLQYPLFLGGSRLANWKIQNNLKKSLTENLKNKEAEVVLQALESYFQVILAENLIEVNNRAKNAAEANFIQVEKFYELGGSSQLDYLRAKARYTSSIPPLTTAINSKKLTIENLKYILNINPQDSLIILDTLQQKKFLGEFEKLNLEDMQKIALHERTDLKGLEYQRKVVKSQKLISASQFLPTIVLLANVQHQAQINTPSVSRKDFIRAKSAGITMQISLFQGGRRVLEYQQAKVNDKKAALQLEHFQKSIILEVESHYNKYREAESNLESLLQSTQAATEALRLANLTYREGISTQVDVLGAQLALTNSEVEYQQGIFQYNISQLELLKSIGKLYTIWEEN